MSNLACDWIDAKVALPAENTRCIVFSRDGQIVDAYKDKRWLGGWVTKTSASPRRRNGVGVPCVTHWTEYPSRLVR